MRNLLINEIENLKIPPHNLEAEQSVLGSLMLDKDAIIKIADVVKVGDFYKDDHNLIYEKMLALYEERRPIDLLTLNEKLKAAKNKSVIFCSFSS